MAARKNVKTVSERDLYYLRSIQRHLDMIHDMSFHEGASLGGEVLADNINWLDCFIEKHERGLASPNHAEFYNG